MRHFPCIILVFSLLWSSCGHGKDGAQQELKVVQKVSLRETPDENGRETLALRPGQGVEDLGETSVPESQVYLNGQYFQAPWIKVKAGEGQQGWAPAWAFSGAGADWLLEKRIQAYFGKGIQDSRDVCVHSLEAPADENALANSWRLSVRLRDTMLEALSTGAGIKPGLQMNWIGDVLPGFIYQPLGSSPGLFADFNFWYQKAQKTGGHQDDLFFQTCLNAFAVDSIESPAPVWRFALSTEETLSNLGKGNHLEMLKQIGQAIGAGRLLAPELNVMREQVLADIFEEKAYWQSREKILDEIDHILSESGELLQAQEKEALQIRRKMFEAPEMNGLRLNLRAGG